MKWLNEAFEESTMRELRKVKGSRTWKEAIIQEFGVDSDE